MSFSTRRVERWASMRWHRADLLAAAMLIPFVVLAFWLGSKGLVGGEGDPYNIARRTYDVAAAGPLATIDPPLRYVPLAILYLIVQPSLPVAEQLVHTYSALVSLVVIPLALYLYAAAALESRVTGLVAMAGIYGVWFLTPLFPAYFTYYWMYDYTVPYMVATLYALDRRAVTGDPRWAVLTALGVISVGWNELALALFTAIGVGMALIARRDWLAIGTCVGIGLPAASVFFILPSGAVDHVSRRSAGALTLASWDTIQQSTPPILLHFRELQVTVLLLVIGAVGIKAEGRISESWGLEAVVAALAGGYLAQLVLAGGWLPDVAAAGLWPLVVLLASAVGVRHLERRWDMVADRAMQQVSPVEVAALAVTVPVAVGILGALVVPQNVPLL